VRAVETRLRRDYFPFAHRWCHIFGAGDVKGREEKISEDNATFFRNLLISGTHPPYPTIFYFSLHDF
jgi:hypothetical protein